MKVRELGIENFRKFRKPIRLAGFDDGLNLVCEPNETGKSTVLEALRAVLFERHGSRSDRIQSFRPHGDEVAPIVDLTFEIEGKTWKVRKRFLQKPEVLLEGPGLRATGDEAEERLQGLLGFTRAGNKGADADTRGALGLLWLEQGLSHVLGAPGQAARRTLEDVLAGEVGTVTGGRRTAAVVQGVERSLAELLTATGKPTRRLAEAQAALEAAQAEAQAARQELLDFETVLDRLEGKRNELRRLLADLNDPETAGQLATLEADIQRARIAGQALETAELILREAVARREGLEAREATRTGFRAALDRAAAQLAEGEAVAAGHAEALAAARVAEGLAVDALQEARRILRDAEETRRAAQTAHATLARTRLLAAAFDRLKSAEKIAGELAAGRAAVNAISMTEVRSAQLDSLERAMLDARSAATAGSATLRLDLQSGAPEARLNGALVDRQHAAAVTETQVLELTGVGTLTVEPPLGGEVAQAKLRAAEQDLMGFLADVGFGAPSDARAAARRRMQSEQAVERLEARLADSCPADPGLGIGAGLETLRGALATETSPAAEELASSAAAPEGGADSVWELARTAERDAEGRREAAVDALRAAELDEMRLTAVVERAAAERQRLAADLAAEVDTLDDDALAAQLSEARTGEARALVARDEATRAVGGLDETTLSRRRELLLQKHERMRDDRLGLVQEVAKLEERAKTLGGAGPATRAAAAAETADAARIACARLQDEAEVLSLLDRVIRGAQQEAARRYLAPITKRVAPYVTRLLPNASLAFSSDYAPELLIRGDRQETAQHLSKGTQEQLAVLTRVAFADLLIEKGKPASLVLDDALVFADDDRFETMMEILGDAAQRMQVIILSCRTSAYRAVAANRIVIG